MPFTFSHPAIILPLTSVKKWPFSFTGLVVGSIVPDFEFLFRLRETEIFAHTPVGIIVFDLPFAIILSFVFHGIIRNTLILNLPIPLQQRLYPFTAFNWNVYFKRHVLNFFISVAIGLGSHFFLDAFTHAYGVFVTNTILLRTTVQVLFYTIPVYYILQLLLSLCGAMYIGWFVFTIKKVAVAQAQNNPLRYWLLIWFIGIVFFILRLYVYPQYQSVNDIIIAFFGCLVYALLLVSLYYHRYTKKTKKAL